MTKPAILALADGSIFRGEAIGADGQTVGEVVFNTAMTGYQEILTDPSYAQQIVTLTYPHIGNTGTTPEDAESNRVWSAGLVIRDLPLVASNWRSTMPLSDYLKANNVVAIAGIDTRRLTRILREKGAQNGCIMAGDNISEEAAIAAARGFPGLKGMDLAKVVSTTENYEWRSTVWDLKTDSHADHRSLRAAVSRGRLRLRRQAEHPAHAGRARLPRHRGAGPNASRLTCSALKPDGVFLSNGPGDPEPCDYAIQAIKDVLETEIPVFGICLGHQLLALASGAKTLKMGHGHHGANHPVQDLDTGVVMITSQNHGFAVDEATLPANVRATHKSLFDGTLQGIERTDKSAFSFQGHPEASPGPNDVAPLFDRFINEMAKRR